ncbi:aspartate/glutamate racemase family protein [Jannaschia sp. 2305UL9-9]|uniref:aspartate/glutamate racemase family protein n=1 Tax=Jannaschia sp. 2305UL9-9 TaxID=3121638 RepID=UPI003526DE8F
MIAPRVLLINPNGTDSTGHDMAAIASDAVPSVCFDPVSTPGMAPVITTPETLDEAAAHVAARDIPDDVHGVIVAAFGDPGLMALRRRLACPVVGIAEASMLRAAEGGARFSVATTTPALVGRIEQTAQRYGVADQMLPVRLTEGAPLPLMQDPELLRQAMLRAVLSCVEDGAERVIIGGGPLARVARLLIAESPVPLIEPVPEAARRIADLISGR